MKVPNDVRRHATLGIKMMNAGFAGGTQTGWDRAYMLQSGSISTEIASVMRAWFARHGPSAANGGTSYVGYIHWLECCAEWRKARGIAANERWEAGDLITTRRKVEQWLRDTDQSHAPHNIDAQMKRFRGAVSWLIWGGTPALLWIHDEYAEVTEGGVRRYIDAIDRRLIDDI